MALARFYVPRLNDVETPAEAVQTLIVEFIMEHIDENDPVVMFRKEQLWKLEVCDLFKSNLESCKQLMKEYHNPMKKTFTA